MIIGYHLYKEWRAYDPEFLYTPKDLSIEAILGVWEANYGRGKDRLIIEDTRFKQIYVGENGYRFETNWNTWTIEDLGPQGFRLHLNGARFYALGPEFAEQDGMHPPAGRVPAWPIRFWDPFANDFIEMPHKLVVQVRVLPSGELVLHHLTPPNGETILWGKWAIFRKIK